MSTRNQYLRNAINTLIAKHDASDWKPTSAKTFAETLANCPSIEEIGVTADWVDLAQFTDGNGDGDAPCVVRIFAIMGDARLATASVDGVIIFAINPDYM